MSALDELAEEEVVENPTLRAAYNMAPLHQNEPLHWDYEVHLIGEKIYDKTIHLCEICELPILVYGRMLPCKHIFCFDCARKCDKTCRRCGGKVQKVEKSALGTVYVCTYGAPKHSTKGCRRTYLSQRDLQSHHAHRHLPKQSSSKPVPQAASVSSTAQPAPNQLPMTQQQAQAVQQQKHVQQAAPPRGLMSPSQGIHQLPPSSVQASPVLPGLGGQASPHLPPSASPKPLIPAMGLPYSVAPSQASLSDVYRPLDVVTMGPGGQQRHAHQHHQQPQHHLQQQGGQGIQPAFGQQPQFQQGMDNMMTSPGLHTIPMSQQQQGLPISQGSMDSFTGQQNPGSSPGLSQSRSNVNVNLITVPIQDEGQYRPQPFVNTSMMSQPTNVQVSSFNSQARPVFPQHGMQTGYPPAAGAEKLPAMAFNSRGNAQGMAGFNQGGSAALGLGFSSQPSVGQASQAPQMMSAGAGFNQPVSGQNSRMGFNQPPVQPQAGKLPGFSPGLRLSQPPPGMSKGVGGATGPPANIPPNIAKVVQAINMAPASRAHNQGVAGMMQGGVPTGGGNQRYQVPPASGRWPGPPRMQHRMGGNQGQPRLPRDGSSFNQGPYYN